MSIDIIGSTKIKNELRNNKKNSSSWSHLFKTFFEEVDFYLAKEYKKMEDRGIPYPWKWRIIGDEIVYFSRIENIEHLLSHIQVAIEFSKSFNNKENKSLQVKITSWLAGFPVNNALFYTSSKDTFKNNNRPKISPYQDINFLGPCIDTGFRISKYADLNKFVISIDLALTLLVLLERNTPTYELNFYFDNEKETKGINGGVYPIIWINTGNDNNLEFLLEKSKPCTIESLKEYCISYMKNNNIYVPFVLNQNDEFFKYSENYEKEFEKISLLFDYEEDIKIGEDSSQVVHKELIKTTLDDILK